ncbi:MAG: hypothetical protein KDA52_01275 [Planctomycetaceae bacterium]|nr:hypothetical protein [Planctomycetaceae bacterium]
MHVTMQDGITFYEGFPEIYQPLAKVDIEIGGMLVTQSQLKTLRDVKRELAARASKAGGNAIVNFQCGQKSVGFFRSIFQLDDINWYGTGIIAQVSN